jgi:hypothetical protein
MASFITVDRKILKWEWYQDIKVFHLFLYMLLRANWEDGRWKGVDVKRGQLITGRLQLNKDTGLSEREIRTCLNKLKTTGEIAIKTTSKYSVITICKYDVYQNKYDKSDQQIDQQIDQRETNKRPTRDQQTTTNNTLNNKEEEGIIRNFINKPLPENFNGLPEIKIGSVIQLFKITKQTDVSPDDVSGLWEVFKIQNLTGKKFYEDEDAVYSHFINWSKKQNIEKNGTTSNKKNSTDYKSAGANNYVDRIERGISELK